MPTITIRNEEGQIVEKEIVSRRAVIAELSDNPQAGQDDLTPLLEPAVPQRIEYEDEGGMSTITTVCGESESRRSSDKGLTMVLEGIITRDQLDDAKSISSGDNLTLVSDLHTGSIEVKRVTIEQNTDIIHFVEDGDQQLAFPFQMQFKEPDSTG